MIETKTHFFFLFHNNSLTFKKKKIFYIISGEIDVKSF